MDLLKELKKNKITHPAGLCLDNLVYNRHGEVLAIRRSDLARFDHPDMGHDYGIYGIPLDKWTLLAAGLETNENEIEYSIPLPIGNGSELFVDEEGSNYKSVGIKNANGSIYFEDIQYVHELQNIYFSISKKELPVKESINQLTFKTK